MGCVRLLVVLLIKTEQLPSKSFLLYRTQERVSVAGHVGGGGVWEAFQI